VEERRQQRVDPVAPVPQGDDLVGLPQPAPLGLDPRQRPERLDRLRRRRAW